jgi:hypothetical protein
MRGRYILVLIAVAVIVAALYVFLFHIDLPPSDHNSIPYILWRHGYSTMNEKHAVEVMLEDQNRNDLVVGKTQSELAQRFTLITPAQALPYYRRCYEASAWKGHKALFIKSTPWLIVFNDDKAVELLLVKGC